MLKIAPNVEKWAEQGIVDRDFWCTVGEQGVMSGSIAEEYDGFGGGIGFDAITVYEQGRTGDTGWGYGIQSTVIHYLNAYGSEEQKKTWLPKLVSGDHVAAIAMTESGTGSDLQNVQTYAEKDGNRYKINGSMIFITNGHTADLVVIVAKTDRNAGAEGFRRGRNLTKLGMKGSDTAELCFEHVSVPTANLLGPEEGQGFYQLMKQLPWERLMIGITTLGFIDFAIAETAKYVQDRKAFGSRIMDFQNTRFKLAERKTKAKLLRSFVNDGLARLEAGELDGATASMAKWWGSQT